MDGEDSHSDSKKGENQLTVRGADGFQRMPVMCGGAGRAVSWESESWVPSGLQHRFVDIN